MTNQDDSIIQSMTADLRYFKEKAERAGADSAHGAKYRTQAEVMQEVLRVYSKNQGEVK